MDETDGLVAASVAFLGGGLVVASPTLRGVCDVDASLRAWWCFFTETEAVGASLETAASRVKEGGCGASFLWEWWWCFAAPTVATGASRITTASFFTGVPKATPVKKEA